MPPLASLSTFLTISRRPETTFPDLTNLFLSIKLAITSARPTPAVSKRVDEDPVVYSWGISSSVVYLASSPHISVILGVFSFLERSTNRKLHTATGYMYMGNGIRPLD